MDVLLSSRYGRDELFLRDEQFLVDQAGLLRFGPWCKCAFHNRIEPQLARPPTPWHVVRISLEELLGRAS